MTSSSNNKTNRPRRRLAGERRLSGDRRPPHAAGSRPVAEQSGLVEATSKSPSGTSQAGTSQAGTSQAGTQTGQEPPAGAKADELAVASARGPSWMVAGVALVMTTALLVTSLVIWRAADESHTQVTNQSAAASAATTIVEKMLGYDYKSFDQHTGEVSALLTGPFKKEFVTAATTVVKPLAVQNKAIVVAKVSKASVMGTPEQGDIKILAFVDQSTTSAKLQRPQIDQNRVILTMSQANGRWLVSKIEAF